MVLSRVVASSEALEMEIANAEVNATSDAAKGVEAARVEALRTHLNALRAVQQECHAQQMEAEMRVRAMNKDLSEVCGAPLEASGLSSRPLHFFGAQLTRRISVLCSCDLSCCTRSRR